MEAIAAFWDANAAICICLLLGFGLLGLELVVPGFSVVGVLGGIGLLAGIALTFVRHGPGPGFGVLSIVAAVGAAIGVGAYRSFMDGRLSRSPIVLSQTSDGNATKDLSFLLGQEGVSITALHPGGMSRFGKTTVDVVSDGLYIPKGTPVRVTGVEGAKVLVTAVKGGAEPFGPG